MLSFYLFVLRSLSRFTYILKNNLNYSFNKIWSGIYLLLPKNKTYITTVNNHRIIRLKNDHQQTLYSTGKSGLHISDFISKINYPFIFIDIGANHGIYTLDAHQNSFLINSHSIEPNPESFKYLLNNIKFNSIKSSYFYNFALSINNKKVSLTIHPWHSGLSNISGRGGERKILVDAKNHSLFDEIFSKNRNCFYVIKCDTEGLEPTVIRNLIKSRISKFVSALIIEITPEWLSLKEQKMIINDLSSMGFKTMKLKKIFNTKKQKDLIFTREIFLNQLKNN